MAKIAFDAFRFRADILAKGEGRVLRKIAPELEISAPTLSRILNGKNIDLMTYAKICSWLGVSMNKYFGETMESKMKDILLEIVDYTMFESIDKTKLLIQKINQL